MFQEINAAVEHLLTLLHPSIDAAGFKRHAHTSLETRFAHIWFPHDAVRASALRVVLWHGHEGGEGQDKDIRLACSSNCKTGEDSPNDCFSCPFTLWIDPGCVAIRLGHGPGICLSQTPSSLGSTKVIYHSNEQRSTLMQPPPVLTLSPSTPALNSSNNTWSSSSGHAERSTIYSHVRSPSASSAASSMTGSRSTSQSSYLSSADDGDQCPSLTATSAHDSDSELSIEDMIDSGCYKNFDIIDDEDECEQEEDEQEEMGDETITENMHQKHIGDVTVGASESKVSIVNYDGGNVGVLGGGIRLGASKKPATSTMPHSTGHRHSHTNFLTNYAPPLPSPNTLQGFEQSLGFPSPSAQQQYMMMDGYAIPVTKRTRSRGRRSRGRGAGRAARRQAAALQTLMGVEQTSSSEHAFDDHEAGEDERIMAVVRQRADQVAKNLASRQMEQENRRLDSKVQYPPQQHFSHQQYHQQQHYHHQPQYQPIHAYHHQQQSSYLQTW